MSDADNKHSYLLEQIANGEYTVTANNGNGDGNMDKRTVELLLSSTTEALGRVAVSQSEMASAILRNSVALDDNSKQLTKITSIMGEQVEEFRNHNFHNGATLTAIELLPEAFRKVVAEEIQNVPNTSWNWIFDRISKIGSSVGGIGIFVVIIYMVIQWALAGLQ